MNVLSKRSLPRLQITTLNRRSPYQDRFLTSKDIKAAMLYLDLPKIVSHMCKAFVNKVRLHVITQRPDVSMLMEF